MDDEQFIDAAFPIHGLDTSHGFEEQIPLTTRLGVNVRAFEGTTQRGRGGSRPGLAKFIPAQLPTGATKIQCVDYVVDPAADALLDSGPDFDGPVTPWPGELGWFVRTGGTGIQFNKKRKLTPLISWANPADIAQGTALGGTQLNAQAFDPRTLAMLVGTFVYTPPAGTVLPTGDTQALKTTFSPSDTTHYRQAKATVHINVKSSVPVKYNLTGFDATGSVPDGSPVTTSVPGGTFTVSVTVSHLVSGHVYFVRATYSVTTTGTPGGGIYFQRTGHGTDTALTASWHHPQIVGGLWADDIGGTSLFNVWSGGGSATLTRYEPCGSDLNGPLSFTDNPIWIYDPAGYSSLYPHLPGSVGASGGVKVAFP